MSWFEKLDARINLAVPKLTYDHDIVSYELTVAEADAFLDYIQLDCSFTRQKKLKRGPLKPLEQRVYKQITPTRAGQDLYLCQYANSSPPVKEGAVSRKVGKKCNCLAKARFNFPANYKHTKDGRFNVEEFGDLIVRVTWHWEHNHDTRDIKNFGNAPLTKRMKELVKLFVLNRVSYADIEEKTVQDSINFDPKNPSEFFKLKRYHISNERKKILTQNAIKDSSPQLSLKIWAKDIESEGGMAIFHDFGMLDDPFRQKYKENIGSTKWSYAFMSSWQRDRLKSDGQVFYLDSTHNTCMGFNRTEKVYLFTILVKSSITGQGVPCAFLITNSQHKVVITDFLKKVQTFSKFEPSRAVIDCDQSEKGALAETFPGIRIVFCRWHVQRAFRMKVSSKISAHTPREQLNRVREEVKTNFYGIIRSNSVDEALERSRTFLDDYKIYPDLVEYFENQWLKEIKTMCATNDVPSAMTNNYVEAWHSKLKRCFLKHHRKQRVDVLLYVLYRKATPLFHTNEIRVQTGGARRTTDTAEKKSEEKVTKLSKKQIADMIISENDLDLLVSSFTTPGQSYSVVFLSSCKSQATCSCPYFEIGNSWCKHIFLALKWYDLSAYSSPQGNHTVGNESSSQGDVNPEPCETNDTGATAVENMFVDLHHEPNKHMDCSNVIEGDDEPPFVGGMNDTLPNSGSSFVGGMNHTFPNSGSSFVGGMNHTFPNSGSSFVGGMNHTFPNSGSSFVGGMNYPPIGVPSHLCIPRTGNSVIGTPNYTVGYSVNAPLNALSPGSVPTTMANHTQTIQYHNLPTADFMQVVAKATQNATAISEGVNSQGINCYSPTPKQVLDYDLKDKQTGGRDSKRKQTYVNLIEQNKLRKMEKDAQVEQTRISVAANFWANQKKLSSIFNKATGAQQKFIESKFDEFVQKHNFQNFFANTMP